MTAAEIAEITQYAKSFNQRLGQFIDNAISFPQRTVDLFYITDEELIAACRHYATTYKENEQ